MGKIQHYGSVKVPVEIVEAADKVKLQSYSFTKPVDFDVHSFANLPGGSDFIADLSEFLDLDPTTLDVVFFSCCSGAEMHTDKLDPNKFKSTTYVIPVILPEKGKKVLFTEQEEENIKLFNIYEFNHEEPHGLWLDDTESGCVVLMVGVLK